MEVVDHEEHCFQVLFHDFIGDVVQKVGGVHAGAGEEDGVGAFVKDGKGEFVVFCQAGKTHGLGKASHGVVPVGGLVQVLMLDFLAPELEFGLEKFLHQGEEKVFMGLPVQVKEEAALFLLGEDGGHVYVGAYENGLVHGETVEKGKGRQNFPCVLVQVAEHLFIHCAEKLFFLPVVHEAGAVVVPKTQVLYSFGNRKGFLLLQFVVGNGIIQVHQLPSPAASGLGISAVQEIAFQMFLQEKRKLRRRFHIGRSHEKPQIVA